MYCFFVRKRDVIFIYYKQVGSGDNYFRITKIPFGIRTNKLNNNNDNDDIRINDEKNT